MPVSRAVLVTGCSSGIGHATALRLVGKGWTVYATARRPEVLGELEAAGCRTLPLDVCDEASMTEAVSTVQRQSGAVGVLVNNAGYGQQGPVEEVALDAVRRQLETNVVGPVRLTQLVLPGMRAQGWGRIVNVSSVGGRLTFPGGGVYHASKHAVEALSDALRHEVRGFGVRVVVVEPGLIRTRFGDTATATIAAAEAAGPYASFDAALARRVTETYERPSKLTSAGPEVVAKVIERAIRRSRPRTRYVVTGAARMLLGIRALLPDAWWDAFLRTQFPTPRSET